MPSSACPPSDNPADEAVGRAMRHAVSAVDEILASRQVVFVTGKGGVGKSVVAASLALRATALGLRPLLFECDAPARPSLFPGGRPVQHEMAEVAPNILAINQDADGAIRAYALDAVPSKTIAELLLDNRFSRLFLQASPSVAEMALIGRIAHHAETHHIEGPVIVDLHATGHALHVLRAPDGIMRVLRAGPVFERASAVRELIFDPSRSAVLTVALAEELPVTELLEFHAALDALGAPLGPVFLNGLMPDPTASIPQARLSDWATHADAVGRAAQDAQMLRQWAARAEREQSRLMDGVAGRRDAGRHVISLPYVIAPAVGETLASTLAHRLAVLASGGDA